jgi:hypothetical protein
MAAMWNAKQHSYEEVREVVVDTLLNRTPNQWENLLTEVANEFERRSGQRYNPNNPSILHPHDSELVRDVFWDLFRQGFITLGMNSSNPTWPWFRLSHFGQQRLKSLSPYRFHDTISFLTIVRKEVPDISNEAITYLDEAVAAFYAGCLLASCVMLGVAAEAEFLRLVDVAAKSTKHGKAFSPIQKETFVRQKITKFRSALKPLTKILPRQAIEDFETNFDMIQSVLRIARNDAGHPNAAAPEREQVYIYLQLFVPFARQLMRLRQALK